MPTNHFASIVLQPVAFAALPANPEAGMLAIINDAPLPGVEWDSSVGGGGAHTILVVWNATLREWIGVVNPQN